MLQKFQNLFFPHDGKPNHFPHLDGLRGIAVLMVLFSHASIFGFHIHPLLNFGGIGRVGVFLFFILSAYLLDKQIVEMFLIKKANKKYWLNYVLRRILRIFPLLFISLIFYYLLNRKYLGTFITGWDEVVKHLTLQKGTFFYWSIPVEFKYYLLSPLLLWVCYKLFNWDVKKCFLLIFFALAISIAYPFFADSIRISTTVFLPAFLMGTSLVLLEKFSPNILKFNFFIPAFISALLIILSTPFFAKLLFDINWQTNEPKVILLYSLLLSIIFLATHFNKGLFQNIAKWKFLRFFGAISYSLYLFHWAFLLAVQKFGYESSSVNLVIYLIASIVFSVMSYLLVEFPLSKINLSWFRDSKQLDLKNEGVIVESHYKK